MKASYVQNLGH